MKPMKYVFGTLFFLIGVVGLVQAIVADTQNREGVFIGGYLTGINALTIMGLVLACMGFVGTYLIMRTKM